MPFFTTHCRIKKTTMNFIKKLTLCSGLLTLTLFAAQEQTVTTSDGVGLYTKKAGKGPVAVYVHGGPGAWSRSFEDLKGNELEKFMTVIYYDQRGSGRSESAKNGDYSLERMARDIEEIRTHYGVPQVYLVAHSFGGIIATAYADRFSPQTRGLVLLNSTLNVEYSLRKQVEYLNHYTGRQHQVRSTHLLEDFMNAKKEIGDKGLDYILLSESKAAFDRLMEVDAMKPQQYDFASRVFSTPEYLEDHTPLTRGIKVPVLVINGTKDHAIGKDHPKSFQFPNMKIVDIPGSHLLYYEQNSVFTEAVRSFVK